LCGSELNAVEQASRLSKTATVVVSYSSGAAAEHGVLHTEFDLIHIRNLLNCELVVQAVHEEITRPVMPNIFVMLTAVVCTIDFR